MSDVTIRNINSESLYFEKNASKPFTGVLTASYDNGNPLSIQEFKDGLGNGIWVNYDPLCNKEEQGTYINNRVEGPVTR